jgi:hypothetical protein
MEPQLTEQVKLAFQFAADFSKQLITLATGVIALSITLQKEIIKEPSRRAVRALRIAWVLYLLSILGGVWSLMALTGSLAPRIPAAPPSTIESNARLPAMFQIVAFAIATILLVAHAWSAPARGQQKN